LSTSETETRRVERLTNWRSRSSSTAHWYLDWSNPNHSASRSSTTSHPDAITTTSSLQTLTGYQALEIATKLLGEHAFASEPVPSRCKNEPVRNRVQSVAAGFVADLVEASGRSLKSITCKGGSSGCAPSLRGAVSTSSSSSSTIARIAAADWSWTSDAAKIRVLAPNLFINESFRRPSRKNIGLAGSPSSMKFAIVSTAQDTRLSITPGITPVSHRYQLSITQILHE
jgi:hypothetical protein